MLFLQAIFLVSVVAGPVIATDMGEVNLLLSLGKFGNNLTLDDCYDWDSWDAPTEAQDVWHYYRSGYDNEGNVVYVSEFGKLRFKKLAEKSNETIEEFWKYYEQSLLRNEYDAQFHNNGDGIAMLFDFEGFAFANYESSAALQLSLKMFTTLERLNKAIQYGFAINVDYAGETFIELARPFLDKLELYGTIAEKWKPKLLRKIPADQLPSKYGGSHSWKPLPIHVCNV